MGMRPLINMNQPPHLPTRLCQFRLSVNKAGAGNNLNAVSSQKNGSTPRRETDQKNPGYTSTLNGDESTETGNRTIAVAARKFSQSHATHALRLPVRAASSPRGVTNSLGPRFADPIYLYSNSNNRVAVDSGGGKEASTSRLYLG